MNILNERLLFRVFMALVFAFSNDIKSSHPVITVDESPIGVISVPSPKANMHAKFGQDEIIRYLDYRLNNIQGSRAKEVNVHLLARVLEISSYAELDMIIDQAFGSVAMSSRTPVLTTTLLQKIIKEIREGVGDEILMSYAPKEVKVITAIHEAGHAVASVYHNQRNLILYDASIVGLPGSYGATKHIHLQSLLNLSESKALKEHIIYIFAGGVAQQVFQAPRDFAGKSFVNYVSNSGCRDDFLSAQSTAKIIAFNELHINSNGKSIDQIYNELTDDEKHRVQMTVNAITAECYDMAWDFVFNHKNEIEKVAQLLLEKYTISGDDVYDLLGLDRPLFNFEQGPLPESLVPNYELRGLYDVHPDDVGDASVNDDFAISDDEDVPSETF